MSLPWQLVSVTGTEVRDGLRVYLIEVKPTDTAEPTFVLKKRYNMFRHLHNEVKALCKGRRLAFPEKQLSVDYEKRRVDLDEWLAETVSMAREEEHAPVRTLLYEFLSERSVDPSIDLTPFHDASVTITSIRIPEYEERDGTIWYAVDIFPKGVAAPPVDGVPTAAIDDASDSALPSPQTSAVRMWKTYTMLKHLHNTTLFSTTTFPGKSITKLTSEKALTERQQELDTWFVDIINAAQTDTTLMEKVRTFCIPNDDDEELSSTKSRSPERLSDSTSDTPKPEPFCIKAARLTGTEERGGTVYYKVEVTAVNNAATPSENDGVSRSASGATMNYSLWKRYNMFLHLCDTVAAFDCSLAADFPAKSLARKAGPGSDVQERKHNLDFWLAYLITAASGQPDIQPHVVSFLDQSQRMTSVFNPRLSPDITSVSIPSFEDRQGTVFYIIDVELEDGTKFHVSKSYSMFHELCSTCANLQLGSLAFQGFPPKHVNLIKKMTCDNATLLKERHEALASWFQKNFERSHVADYEHVKDAVREFLDSNHV